MSYRMGRLFLLATLKLVSSFPNFPQNALLVFNQKCCLSVFRKRKAKEEQAGSMAGQI